MRIFHVIFCSLFLFSMSCSLQKRIYRKGFYSDMGRNESRSQSKRDIAFNSQLRQPVKEIKAPEPLLAYQSINENRDFIMQKKIHDPDSCKDHLLLRKGQEIKGKVLTTSPYFITYYDCKTDSTITLSNDEIFIVKYENGKKKVYKAGRSAQVHQLTNISLILCCFAVFITPPFFGLYTAIVALKQINKEPDKYKGRRLTKTAVILNSLFALVWLTVFTVIFIHWL